MKTLVLLIVLFSIAVTAPAKAIEAPQNAHVVGNSWYCNDGYRRDGNSCTKLNVPPNAHVLGNSWYCNDGYSRSGDSCLKLDVPSNAHVLGNSWYCNDGYSRSGDSCLKLDVPSNAHVLGNSWYCNDGYQRQGDDCIKLSVPANAHVLGNNWYCNDGFKRVGVSCSRMSAEEEARLEQLMRERRAQQTDGTVAFITKIDSDHGDVLKLENDGIVEVTSGYLGYIGYRKDAILIGRGSRCQIAIEGKRTFECEVLKMPSDRGKPAKELQVSEVRGDGSILITTDGEIYEVESVDHITTTMWLGFFDAILVEGHQLINLDSGESVAVHKIRWSSQYAETDPTRRSIRRSRLQRAYG